MGNENEPKTITLTIDVGYATGQNGCRKDDTVEVDIAESYTPEEVEAACENAMQEWLSGELDTWWSYQDGRERLT